MIIDSTPTVTWSVSDQDNTDIPDVETIFAADLSKGDILYTTAPKDATGAHYVYIVLDVDKSGISVRAAVRLATPGAETVVWDIRRDRFIWRFRP